VNRPNKNKTIKITITMNAIARDHNRKVSCGLWGVLPVFLFLVKIENRTNPPFALPNVLNFF